MKFMIAKDDSKSLLQQLRATKRKVVFSKWELLQMYFALAYYTMIFKKAGCKRTKSELLITKLDNILHDDDNDQSKKKNGK